VEAFDLAAFRLLYPQFAAVSDEVVLAVAEQALCLISGTGCDCDAAAWQLMVAHLLQLQAAATSGGGGTGPIASATIGGVSVSFQAPPTGSSAYKYWLFTTPYGAQLAAMLARCAAGGVYVGGAPERAAFRRVGGGFPNRGKLWLR
jgi:hypothetical protein